MNHWHLRMALRNHSAIYRWEQIPIPIRDIFNGSDPGICFAEFFIANSQQSKGHFRVTQWSCQQKLVFRADVIAIQQSELAILVNHCTNGKKVPHSVSLPISTIESIAYRAKSP
jgi:hypothetical protein